MVTGESTLPGALDGEPGSIRRRSLLLAAGLALLEATSCRSDSGERQPEPPASNPATTEAGSGLEKDPVVEGSYDGMEALFDGGEEYYAAMQKYAERHKLTIEETGIQGEITRYIPGGGPNTLSAWVTHDADGKTIIRMLGVIYGADGERVSNWEIYRHLNKTDKTTIVAGYSRYAAHFYPTDVVRDIGLDNDPGPLQAGFKTEDFLREVEKTKAALRG